MTAKKLPNHERVRVWNSFLHLGRNQAVRLAGSESTARVWRRTGRSGGRLSEEQETILASLAFATLAVEARVNHLLEEQFEEGRITRAACDAALRLPPQHK